MRRVLPVLALVALSGCDHYVDLTPDSFVQGTTPRLQFLTENAKCQNLAEDARARGGNGDPHGTYNASYRVCMLAKGYRLVTPNTFDAQG